jgi:hypothetical protein
MVAGVCSVVTDYCNMVDVDDLGPLLVGALVAAILLIGQPLSGSYGSLDMNVVGAAVVMIGGIVATFQ